MANQAKEMFVPERFKLILEYLEVHKRATVEELAAKLFVSPATMRRDFAAMQKLGMLQRTHGGAIYLSASDDVSIFVRMEKESASKEAVATVALNHLPEFKSCFVDNSSTAFALADRLDLSFKTIVTNGLQVAAKLSEKKNVEVIFLGGTIRYSHYASTGIYPCKMMKDFNLDLMLSGSASLRPEGAYERSLETMEMKRTALECCRHRILLVDKSKFNENFIYRTAALDQYDLICTDADNATIAPFLSKGIHIFNR
ncbi:MAG: DeoR/GlpR transcriptional regulator [Bacilli bacterium]|nr:DeoR/GlpR transcriptional regulator [Bacilli bacterium]